MIHSSTMLRKQKILQTAFSIKKQCVLVATLRAKYANCGASV